MKIEITLNEPGSLRKLVNERKAEFKNADLKVVGRMNDADIKFLKQVTGKNGYIKAIDLTYASGIERIDRNTFEEGAILSTIRFASSIRELGWGAFCMCERLNSITMTSDIENIENFSFNGCTNLATITLPKNLKNLGNQSFGGCSKLEEFKIAASNKHFNAVEGVLLNKKGDVIVKYPAGKSNKAYVFPSTVKAIGDYAFFMCDQLRNLELPEGIVAVGEYAFGSCSNIQAITLPSTIKEVKNGAFNKCDMLMTLNVLATEPPVFTPDEHLANHISVYVPLQSVDAYRNAEGWKNVQNIFGK